jgi:hypothetical protein
MERASPIRRAPEGGKKRTIHAATLFGLTPHSYTVQNQVILTPRSSIQPASKELDLLDALGEEVSDPGSPAGRDGPV